VQVIPQQAASDKGHTGALYSKNSDPAAEVGMALFTTALDLHGGVLWSGELQGFIAHDMMPSGGRKRSRRIGAPFTFFNTLQSHPAVVLYVYLLPKSTIPDARARNPNSFFFCACCRDTSTREWQSFQLFARFFR
jgi:hypothetical protein